MGLVVTKEEHEPRFSDTVSLSGAVYGLGDLYISV